MPHNQTIERLKTRLKLAVSLLLAAVMGLSVWHMLAKRTAMSAVGLACGFSLVIALCVAILLMTRLLFRHLEHLQATQHLLRQQQELVRLKAVQIDAANDAILLLDMEGRLVQFNNALCQMTGYSAEELRGRRLHDIKPPEYAAQIETNARILLERGEATLESAYLTREGATLPIEVHARTMESDGRRLILSIARDISERKRSEQREQTRLQILEKLATGSSLPDLLTLIVRFVEQQQTGALCSVLLVDEEGGKLRHGAAPSLPDAYNQAVDGLRIGKGMGSCGTAAYTGQRVIVEEIEGHPFWKGFTPAREAGLHACWSEPVLASDGELLGTFAMYHRTPRLPDEAEIQLIESAAHLASIAIERFKAEERRSRLEEQLHHAQKIEAIGQLAGGIAHDFNNLLTPILVYADMIQRKLPDDDPLAGKVQGIFSAACKARDLTRQLLSFGRKQLLTMQTLDLNEIVGSFQDILRWTIRENIDITARLAPGGVAIRADRGQMEQILLNLAVNAQDAIQGNGTIVMETGHVVLDNEYARLHPGVRPGPYAVLAFGDSGSGMDDATLGHIFEPFFTTKEVGHGTGLGLATVYGIIKQHEGYITVRSRIGEGTTFTVYLPLSQEPIADAAGDEAPRVLPAGAPLDRTILVVEDNDMLRDMAVELLESSGYRVLVADRPSQARELALNAERPIDLLLTDVVMPEMTGHDLYECLVDRLPDLRVLYISGYTNEVFVRNGTLEEGINFLQKPFTTEQLLDRVRMTFE
ncbi:MAG TPA: PAS domain S-box protein [Desulfuromonadaceae bacterium]